MTANSHQLSSSIDPAFKLSKSFFFPRYNLSSFYRPSFDKPDYVCSLPSNNGLSKCDKSHFNQQDFNDNESNQTSLTMNSSYWNQFYTTCRDSGQNIYWGSISFDNIGIATVAIFQVSLDNGIETNQFRLSGCLLGQGLVFKKLLNCNPTLFLRRLPSSFSVILA